MESSTENNAHSPNQGRTLVVMAKAPRPGAVKTRLAQGLSVDAVTELYCCLLEDTLALARSLGDVEVAPICRVLFSKTRSKRWPPMTWSLDQRTTEATISSGQRLLILRFLQATEWAPVARWRDSYRAPELLSYP